MKSQREWPLDVRGHFFFFRRWRAMMRKLKNEIELKDTEKQIIKDNNQQSRRAADGFCYMLQKYESDSRR